MFSLKRFVIASLASVLVYVLVMIVIDIYLTRYQPVMEKEIASILQLDEVNIERLYNLPFVFVGAKNLFLSSKEGNTITIKKLRFFYLPSLLWEGLPAIYRIEIEGIKGKIETSEFLKKTNMFPNTQKSQNFYPLIRVRESELQFSLWKTIFFTTTISNTFLRLKPIGWDFSYEGTLHSQDVYGMEYINASGTLSLSSYGPHWWETILTSSLNLTVGGIPIRLLTNFQADMAFYRHHVFHKTNEYEKLRIDFDEKNFSFMQTFDLAYKKLEEKGIFEHYLSPGTYTLKTEWDNKQTSLSASIKGPENQLLSLSFDPEKGKLLFSSHKGGQLSFKWRTNPLGFQLQGNLKNFIIIPYFLKLGGYISLSMISNKGSLAIHDLFINGERTGNTVLQFWQEGNTIKFKSKPDYNLLFEGNIGKDVTVIYEGKRIQGTALTKTVWFNGLNIDKLLLNTKGQFLLHSSGEISITGKVHGISSEREKAYYASSEYAIFVPTSTNTTVSLSNIYFSRENIRGNFFLSIHYPERRWLFVSMKGEGIFPMIGSSSLRLKYTWDGLEETGNGDLFFRTNMHISFEHSLTSGHIHWSISHVHMPFNQGKLQLFLSSSGELSWKNNLPVSLNTTSFVTVDSTTYELQLKGKIEKDTFRFDTVWLDLKSDILIGKGYFIQTNKISEIKVGFIRGGGLLFRWNGSEWETIFDLRKTGIRLPSKQTYFLETAGRFMGTLSDFNGEGQCKLSDGERIFIIRDFQKNENRLDFRQVTLEWRGWIVEGNGFLELSPSRGGWSLTVSSSDGKLLNMNVIGIYEQKDNTSFFSYRVPDWILFQQKQPSFSGEVILTEKEILFTKKQLYGANGRYARNTHQLVLEYLFPFASGNMSGEIFQNKLNLRSQHRVNIGFLDRWQNIRISGNVFAQVNISGQPSSPALDGSIQLQGVSLAIPEVVTKITNQNLRLTLSNEEITLPRQELRTTTGIFWIQGGIKPFEDGLFSFRIGSQKSSDIIRLQMKNFNGSILPEILNITGNLENISLSGNLHLRQSRIFFRFQDLWQKIDNSISLPIQLSLSLFLAQKIAVENELFDFLFEPGSVLKIRGSIRDPQITGKLFVTSGHIQYLSQNFLITEGSLSFENDLFPSVELQSKYKYRDVQENIDIYLTFRGKLPKINLVNFYSIPEKRKEEIIGYLGLPQVITNTNASPQTVQNLFYTGVGFAEEILVLAPLSARLRQQLGLDMLVLRSSIAQNYSRYLTGGISNLTWNALLQGSSLAVGRYVFPNIFLEADISLHGVENTNTLILRPVYSLGISYTFQGFEMGWSYEPLGNISLSQPFQYEQKIEINYKRRF